MIKVKGNNYEVEQWGRKVKKAEAGQARKLPRSGFVHLAKSAVSSISILSTYIVFLTEMQKSKIQKCDLPLLRNDVTQFFIEMICVIIIDSYNDRINGRS